jgi:predicted alpha/beta superfamily hydrolase
MWQDYKSLNAAHTVVGDLRVWKAFPSQELGNTRDILVWLPASYASTDRRYPVLYMHDGQNVFDANTSYAGEWQADETMTALAAEGYEAILVGIPNANERRAIEYCPYPFTRQGVSYPGMGADYIRFIVETLKPVIDRDFRTRPDAAHTGIAGSSMGGLISLYGFLTAPEVFGFCGAFSPAYWFADSRLLTTIQEQANGAGRVYVDVGTQEGPTLANWNYQGRDLHAMYRDGVRALRNALIRKGYVLGKSLLYVEAEGDAHNEAAWARRLPNALRYLLPR